MFGSVFWEKKYIDRENLFIEFLKSNRNKMSRVDFFEVSTILNSLS